MGKSSSKVLIVDDDSRNIFALAATLKAVGYTCMSCMEVVAAREILDKDEHIGIILMDMMMPGIDGYEAIPLLRKSEGYENIPIIAVTAQAMLGDREKCMDAGANDYITKPIDVDKLMQVLRQYIA